MDRKDELLDELQDKIARAVEILQETVELRENLYKERSVLMADLNHHIRNALQIIASSFVERDEVERLRLCREATERICRILQRFSGAGGPEEKHLPGVVGDGSGRRTGTS